MRLLPRALILAQAMVVAVSLVIVVAGCTTLQRATVSRTEYELYRRTRVAPSAEERLAAASRYLAAGYSGPFRSDIEAWFEQEADRRLKLAWDDKKALRACLFWLPEGQRAEEVHARIAHLERLEREEREAQARDMAEARRMQAELEQAGSDRRRFVEAFSEWLDRIVAFRAFGVLTDSLPHEFVAAYQGSEPQVTCEGTACIKAFTFSYLVPEKKVLVRKNAQLEVRLLLAHGAVSAIQLSGPLLWTRLAEALSPRDDLAVGTGRIEALATIVQLVELKIDRHLPLDRCGAEAVSPELLVRRCDGVELRLLAGEREGDPDSLQISPVQVMAAPP